MDEEYLGLKWGTLKTWNYPNNPAGVELIEQYLKLETLSKRPMSAMAHRDSDQQREIILKLIDATNGKIFNGFSGEEYTREQAKEYILNYYSDYG